MSKASDQLQRLRAEYEPYADWVGAELGQIEALETALEKSKDPAWIAFRENPVTQKLMKHCLTVYSSCKSTLANDDGKLTQEERMRLHVSSLWAVWFLKSVGGDPNKARQDVEAQIQSFAESAGVF